MPAVSSVPGVNVTKLNVPTDPGFAVEKLSNIVSGPGQNVSMLVTETNLTTSTTFIGIMSPNGTYQHVMLPSNYYDVNTLVVGADNNLWFGGSASTASGAVVGKVAADGTESFINLPNDPYFMSMFKEANGTIILAAFSPAFTPDVYEMKIGADGHYGAVTTSTYTIPGIDGWTNRLDFTGFAQDRTGNVWAAYEIDSRFTSSGHLDRISPTGAVTRYTLPVPSSKLRPPGFDSAQTYSPQGITTGPDGNIWYTEGIQDPRLPTQIVKVTPNGKFTSFRFTTGVKHSNHSLLPTQIVSGPGKKLYFEVQDIAANGSKPIPQYKLGVVNTSGHVSFLKLPRPSSSNPNGINANGAIATGPDRNLYFENHNSKSDTSELYRIILKK